MADLARRCRWTASVCAGALILSHAALIGARPCVTHASAIEDLRATGADVRAGERVVDDGDLITAGGVTSGLDLALHLIGREAGEATADAVAEHIAYVRRPALCTNQTSTAG